MVPIHLAKSCKTFGPWIEKNAMASELEGLK